ncbi:cystathionine gamma-synthase [Flexivirga endophytica]|uniref:Cystathionine gamma-synthase n=1 Tax=Flexivirga endophytica TaxID=1849103 RepID=A0A916TIM0_9MICO|nr:cystathionine gamma-synthase [Flexivirga endophytica]GGB46847.1 cystathionine gamma-synthase [Flexivirga endophytica]GHB70898.1 cystathionine gamma-synthase [Flexivirga endophytica]
MTTEQPGFSTRAIHAGQEPDPRTGAVVPAIYQTSTYKQDGVGGLRDGYEYSRSGNPTRSALEECIAALEGGAKGFAFSSGLAAEDCIMRAILRPGEHMIIPTDAYGGTFRLVDKVQKVWGVDYSLAKVSQADAIRGEIRPGVTKLVWLETPTNPLLGIADIAAIAQIAHEAGALLVVDNTFASAYLQQPLSLGADIVVHSTTKYSGGHSDVVGGAVVVAEDIGVPEFADAAERVGFHQNSMGAIAGPFDSWLVLRGLKTLAVRMERHCDNAEKVVDYLRGRKDVTHIYYPGLDSHPGHDIAAKQMRRFGGMVSFQLEGGEQHAVDAIGRTKIWTLGESLGGVESLIEHPGRMTHASVAGTELEVPADLIRLSVGLEDPDDLIADLAQALDG